MRRCIDRTLEALPWLVDCEDAGQVNGYAYASGHGERRAYDWSVNLSNYLREDVRGKGIGRRLYTGLLPLLTSR